MTDHWAQLQEIFDQICLLDESSRRRALDQHCAGDQELRAQAERLLRAFDDERAANRDGAAAGSGRRFGAWQTIRLLARGGMGEVWLAQRADGQHEQRAALKILSPYLAAPDSVHRFRRERELLARLEHPNIARLLDGGMSSQGEPYLVMEYVEGVRLDRYCDDHLLTIPERLRLFVKVCAAVSAAHQYFVVHRDLKPGNILVTAGGEPKLLDFGVAKLIDSEAGLEHTATANVFLTPIYSSPEILRGQPATVVSDVYSLGVVLYELLAGRRPFDGSTLSPVRLMEAITREDVARPSSVAPDVQAQVLAGDLDAIALKALAKNPDERYASAAQLSEDIQRYLSGQPVIAVRATWAYVARKFIRRNRLAVSAAAVLTLSLAAGIAGTLWQAHIARQQRASAEQRFNDVRRLANYLLFDLYDSVGKIPGTMPVQADMAGRTLEYLDRLAAIKSDDPGLRLELAQGYLRLGTILSNELGLGDTLGNNGKAVEIGRKALGIIEPLVRERPGDLEIQRTEAAVEQQYGAALELIGQSKEGLPRLLKAAESYDAIARNHPRDVRSFEDAGKGWQTYGKLMSEHGGYISFDSAGPLESLNKSVTDLKAALNLDPGNALATQSLATTLEAIGRVHTESNPAAGLKDFQEALDLLAGLPEGARRNVNVSELTARILGLMGWAQAQLGDFNHALESLKKAEPIMDAQGAADPKNVGAQYRRVELDRSIGIVEGYAGRRDESIEYLKRAAVILEGIIQQDPAYLNYPMFLAELQGRVANLLVQSGRSNEARPYAEASVSFLKKWGERPAATPSQLIECIRGLAETGIPSLRDYPTALRFALRADQLASGKNPAVLGYLAEAYALNKNLPLALEAARRGLAATPETKPGEPSSKLRQWLEGEVQEYQGKIPTSAAAR